MSTRVTTVPGNAREQRSRSSRPTTPAPITSMRSPASGAASQAMFSAVSMLAASTARAVGTASGTGMHIAARRDEDILVRVQHEHARRPSSARPTAL